MAISQNDRHLQRSSWLGAISQGGWLCCARRLSRYWLSRLLAWLRQQWCWLVEAVVVVAEAVAASMVAWPVDSTMVAASVVAASMVAWPAHSVMVADSTIVVDSTIAMVVSAAVDFIAIATSGAASALASTRMTTTLT